MLFRSMDAVSDTAVPKLMAALGVSKVLAASSKDAKIETMADGASRVEPVSEIEETKDATALRVSTVLAVSEMSVAKV